jgi:hypothetical protein
MNQAAAIVRFKERIREQTYRTRGISLTNADGQGDRDLPAGLGLSATVKPPRCCKALNRGYAVDSGRWCGSNGNGVSVRTWQRKLPVVLTVCGGSPTRPV